MGNYVLRSRLSWVGAIIIIIIIIVIIIFFIVYLKVYSCGAWHWSCKEELGHSFPHRLRI